MLITADGTRDSIAITYNSEAGVQFRDEGMPKVGVQLGDECVSSTCEEVKAADFAILELRRQKYKSRETRRCLVDKQFRDTNWDSGFSQKGEWLN